MDLAFVLLAAVAVIGAIFAVVFRRGTDDTADPELEWSPQPPPDVRPERAESTGPRPPLSAAGRRRLGH